MLRRVLLSLCAGERPPNIVPIVADDMDYPERQLVCHA
jgi:hypothetical protein